MNIFKKKESITQSIAFMALMAAINVIFVLLSTFVPFLMFILVFLLPLSCTLVIQLCEKKYFPIYAVATILLCLICTIWNISDTLFYVIPSIITGAFFGLLIDKKLPYPVTIIVCTFVQFGLSYAILPLIKLLTQIDLLDALAVAFGFDGNENVELIKILGVFIVSLMQIMVSFFVIKLGLKKINLNYYQDQTKNWIIYLTLLINLLLTLLFVFIYCNLAFVFFVSSMILTLFAIIPIIASKNKILILVLILGIVLMIFVEAIVYPYINEPFGVMFLETYSYLVLIIGLFNNLLVNKQREY